MTARGNAEPGGVPRRQGAAAVRPPGSRAEYVHTVLRREILDGTLAPGAPILQDEIAVRLGVSITPVREALRRLESVGLVTYQAHYGATVVETPETTGDELYLLRAAVEGLAARLAAERGTADQLAELRRIHDRMVVARRRADVAALASGSRRFHAAIAQIGGPSYLGRYVSWLWNLWAATPLSETIWQFDDVVELAMADHRALLDAIEARDAMLARRLMTEHVEREIALRGRGDRPGPPHGG